MKVRFTLQKLMLLVPRSHWLANHQPRAIRRLTARQELLQPRALPKSQRQQSRVLPVTPAARQVQRQSNPRRFARRGRRYHVLDCMPQPRRPPAVLVSQKLPAPAELLPVAARRLPANPSLENLRSQSRRRPSAQPTRFCPRECAQRPSPRRPRRPFVECRSLAKSGSESAKASPLPADPADSRQKALRPGRAPAAARPRSEPSPLRRAPSSATPPFHPHSPNAKSLEYSDPHRDPYT